MTIFATTIKCLSMLVLALALSACGGDESNKASSTGTVDSGNVNDLKKACASFPQLAFCNSEPRPGMAKFQLGGAGAVRWVGNDGCVGLDIKTGEQNDEQGLTKAEGEINSTCDDGGHYRFVYRQHTRSPQSSDSWTSAFMPLDESSAKELLRSCTWESKPAPGVVMGNWWKANNTYAENMLLDFVSPQAYAARLIPFDDDGYEQIGEEAIDGIESIQFRNDRATVWMMADDSDRPLRVVHGNGKVDLRFTEWDQPFPGQIPADMRSLSEICDINK